MPENTDLILPVFLRQERRYIQGTQIIARCANALDGTGWSLSRTQFNSITDHLIKASPELPDGPHLGNVQFHRNDETHIFYLEAIDQPAPMAQSPMPITIERNDSDEEATAVYRYDNAKVFEDVLNVLVQSVKSEHEYRYEGATDIWLTGMRNFDLKCQPDFSQSSGEIGVSLFRHMGRDQQHQTIWNFGIRPDGATEMITGATTFAYKTDHPANAD